MTILDILYQTRETLQDEDVPFIYANWAHCTCGHICQATLGRPVDRKEVTEPTDRCRMVIEAVASALGWTSEEEGGSPKWWVSAKTVAESANDGETTRKHALLVIDKAIAVLESQPLVLPESDHEYALS